MARPPIVPTSVRATAPEVFPVLQLRMRVVEEQTSALLQELEALGGTGQSLHPFPSKTSEAPTAHSAISPVQARVAFVGENTLWKNCETLVNRMCWLESVVQTLKLNIFRLQMEKEQNPKHAAQLEQCLNKIHEEHLQEMRVVQQEVVKLHQHLGEVRKAENRAKEEVQRLSAALEMMAASKMHVVIAAEELRNTKQKMHYRLQELTEQLTQETSLRESLEESQAMVMCRVQDMEAAVEAEQKQVQILHQDCQELHKDVQLAQVRLQEEEQRATQLEQQCTQLKAELDSRNCIISQLGEEAKNAQLSFSKQHRENLQLQSNMTALREAAEKVQVLNEHLSQKCSELSTTLQSTAKEKAELIAEQQAMLKAEQEVTYKLQEQDLLLNAAHARILGELQSVQCERTELQRELEALHREHSKCRQAASLAEEAATAHRQLWEHAVATLQGQLEKALQEKGALLAGKEDLQQKVRTTGNGRTQERNKWEAEKTENELEMVSMKFTLQTLEEENKRLLDHLAALVHEQQVHLTDGRNKLTCDKGKPQQQLDAAKDEKSHAAMLQHVLASQQKMQAALDAAQTELGHKDTEISKLRRAKSQAQQQILRLETELEHCQAKLVAMGKQHSSQVESLCKALESAGRDKKLLQLEEVLQVNNTLIQTHCELRSKTEQQQLRVCREQFMEKIKTEAKMYAEHLESLKKQLQTEQEASRNGACQESAESQDIQEFVSELQTEQSKMEVMLKNQHEVQGQNRQLEAQLEVERRQRQKLENECQKLEKAVKHLKKYKEKMEEKLKEGSTESEQEKKQEELPTSLDSRLRTQPF